MLGCSFVNDLAVIFDTATLKPVLRLENKTPEDPDWIMFAQNNLARPGSSVWSLSPKGGYAMLSSYDAPTAYYNAGMVRGSDGAFIWNRLESRVVAMDWDSEESLFTEYDAQEKSIRLHEGPAERSESPSHTSGYKATTSFRTIRPRRTACDWGTACFAAPT